MIGIARLPIGIVNRLSKRQCAGHTCIDEIFTSLHFHSQKSNGIYIELNFHTGEGGRY